MNILLDFLITFSFLVYPQKGVKIYNLEHRLKSVCKKVHYYEVGNVFSVSECKTLNIKGIRFIDKIKTYKIPPYKVIKTSQRIDTLPWYVRKINMYKREEIELSGNNVVCGILDSGIDTQDTYLASHIAYFYDATGHYSTPYDDNGHGTAVSSLIAGPYGIAPGVKLAVCKAFLANGTSDDTLILKCADWFYNLKKSGVPIMVINNSWGETEAEYMKNILLKWDSVGILPAFSAGNSGPFYRTIDAPSHYPFTFSIGATTSEDTVAWYSSRGPAPDTGIFCDQSLWPFPFWNYTKPDFVAPGDYIYVLFPGGYYGIASGTSFAVAIFSGFLCLLKEAIPSIDYKEAYRIIKDHGVKRLGFIRYPDSSYGFGRIDVGEIASFLSPKVVYDTTPHLSIPQNLKGTYSIYTQDGRLVEKGETPIPKLAKFPRGAYILKLSTGRNTYTLKIINFYKAR